MSKNKKIENVANVSAIIEDIKQIENVINKIPFKDEESFLESVEHLISACKNIQVYGEYMENSLGQSVPYIYIDFISHNFPEIELDIMYEYEFSSKIKLNCGYGILHRKSSSISIEEAELILKGTV